MGRNASVVVGQSSSTTIIHHSLKRKLETEFEPFVSEISDDLDAIESIMQKSINDKYGLKDEAEISVVKSAKPYYTKASTGVVLQQTAGVSMSSISIVEEKISGHDNEPNVQSTEVIDLTAAEEEIEISPTQVATITESVDVIDLTKVNEDAEVTSKEVIDLTKLIDGEVSSIQKVEDVEVWEVVDLSA